MHTHLALPCPHGLQMHTAVLNNSSQKCVMQLHHAVHSATPADADATQQQQEQQQQQLQQLVEPELDASKQRQLEDELRDPKNFLE
jgi:hypothetical protein